MLCSSCTAALRHKCLLIPLHHSYRSMEGVDIGETVLKGLELTGHNRGFYLSTGSNDSEELISLDLDRLLRNLIYQCNLH